MSEENSKFVFLFTPSVLIIDVTSFNLLQLKKQSIPNQTAKAMLIKF